MNDDLKLPREAAEANRADPLQVEVRRSFHTLYSKGLPPPTFEMVGVSALDPCHSDLLGVAFGVVESDNVEGVRRFICSAADGRSIAAMLIEAADLAEAMVKTPEGH